MAVTIPLEMSSVVGDFVDATTLTPSINAASVFVPPTSTPILIAGSP
jgi:hypothetical protein